MIYAYIVGKHSLSKEFNNLQEAMESIARINSVQHKEKMMYVFSERELSDEERALLSLVQVEV